MKKSSSRIWLAAVGVAVAGAAVWALRSPPAEVDLSAVARGPLVVTIDEQGRTRIKERYIVAAPLAGRLLRLELHPGDAVEAGRTVVAAIEPSDPGLLDPRTRAQAEARVKVAEFAVERSAPQLARARSQHELAAADLQRMRQLAASQTISKQELDAAEHREAEAAAGLRTAQFDGHIADHELAVARAALIGAEPGGDPAAARRLEIRSPISGRVLRVMQESATVTPAGAPLVELGDPADLEIVIEALSTDGVKIRPGARVAIVHWGGDEPLAARVRVVEPAGFTKISALGVEEQRVNVVADFTGPAAARSSLGDSFRVEAQIVIWEGPDVIKVPLGALFRESEAWAVFVLANGRAVRRPVQIGQRSGREAQITSGVAAGEFVIIHPSDRVRDGVAARARDRTRP